MSKNGRLKVENGAQGGLMGKRRRVIGRSYFKSQMPRPHSQPSIKRLRLHEARHDGKAAHLCEVPALSAQPALTPWLRIPDNRNVKAIPSPC